jgi:hypothetical protein
LHQGIDGIDISVTHCISDGCVDGAVDGSIMKSHLPRIFPSQIAAIFIGDIVQYIVPFG